MKFALNPNRPPSTTLLICELPPKFAKETLPRKAQEGTFPLCIRLEGTHEYRALVPKDPGAARGVEMADDRKDLDIEKEEKAAPVRRRDAQMDAIVKAVSKSPRFSHEIASQAFCAAVAKAKRAEGALPGSAEGDEKEKRKRP